MAAVFRCPRCGNQRSRALDQLCSVCYLLVELKREHKAGDHAEHPTSSCSRCRQANPVRSLPPEKPPESIVVPSRRVGPSDAQKSPDGIASPISTRVARSHAGCNHESTPAARAACRKRGGP